ncbi:uncharacterized protein Tco025E_05816 [Trypanosoma conorhini]|uniref:Uncharacterized protein n=1 Tax=Trypanosoma conorhini TaxID=83891 RepID=A0A422PB27_9TRYP|nr:uncharacterized protein Tco025E_05816 [Trypanosoma conorhini]RNF14892.1 hypothetical protein Tco025E_05816 [Trypanosoma conorhini]
MLHKWGQTESLVARQKETERVLVALMQQPTARQDGGVGCGSHAELRKTVQDRNKALQLLHTMQVEGNAVVRWMHHSMQQQLDALLRENTRLRSTLRGGGTVAHDAGSEAAARAHDDSDLAASSPATNPTWGGGDAVQTVPGSAATVAALQASLLARSSSGWRGRNSHTKLSCSISAILRCWRSSFSSGRAAHTPPHGPFFSRRRRH